MVGTGLDLSVRGYLMFCFCDCDGGDRSRPVRTGLNFFIIGTNDEKQKKK